MHGIKQIVAGIRRYVFLFSPATSNSAPGQLRSLSLLSVFVAQRSPADKNKAERGLEEILNRLYDVRSGGTVL